MNLSGLIERVRSYDAGADVDLIARAYDFSAAVHKGHRLAIYWMKSELEDNSLRYLHPEVYYQLKRNVAKKKAERERYIKEVLAILSKRLAENDIEVEVSGRPKHFYSIYQKMQSQNLL